MLRGRRVIIVYDSDAAPTKEVRGARARLATFLKDQGADVWQIDFPDLPTGAKCGADDYLVQGHSLQDLLALARETFPQPQPLVTE